MYAVVRVDTLLLFSQHAYHTINHLQCQQLFIKTCTHSLARTFCITSFYLYMTCCTIFIVIVSAFFGFTGYTCFSFGFTAALTGIRIRVCSLFKTSTGCGCLIFCCISLYIYLFLAAHSVLVIVTVSYGTV